MLQGAMNYYEDLFIRLIGNGRLDPILLPFAQIAHRQFTGRIRLPPKIITRSHGNRREPMLKIAGLFERR